MKRFGSLKFFAVQKRFRILALKAEFSRSGHLNSVNLTFEFDYLTVSDETQISYIED